MSTKRSLGRSTATRINDRLTVARKEDRLTATQEKVRSTAMQENGRSAATQKKDRSGLCAFTFADGRQCRTPHHSGHPHLCYFHAQKEAEALAAKQAGKDISSFFFANLLTACDLSAAMARLFSAVAQGQIKPKVASTLAYLSQTMLQSIPIAQHEYCEAFSSDAWRKAVRSSFTPSAPAPQPAPKPAPPAHPPASKPTPQPTPPPAAQSAHPLPPQPAPQQSPQPKCAPPPPSPVKAGLVYPEPRREPGSSGPSSSSSSSSPDSGPVRTSSTQPTSASTGTLPTPTHPRPTPAPPPLPPGFGAPANWDVLLSPRTRRRFSRQWQSLE